MTGDSTTCVACKGPDYYLDSNNECKYNDGTTSIDVGCASIDGSNKC